MKDGKSIKNIIFILFSSIFLFSCSTKNYVINSDLSNLPAAKKKEVANKYNPNKDEINTNNDEFIKDLVPLKDSKQILSEFKFGKKDPFSAGDTKLNQFSSNFELTGFLNTEEEKYVFVKYLGNEGIISENSIGGLNTEFLPDGAKVINIDTKKRQLIISLDKDDFIFEL